MKISSWYENSKNYTISFPHLKEEIECDVCVIGGGNTGCSASYYLQQKGYSVVVLEKNTIGWGASGRNGGQYIFGFGCSQPTLEKLTDEVTAQQLFDTSLESITLLKSLVKTYHIKCDLKEGHLHAAIKQRHLKEIEKDYERLTHKYNYTSLKIYCKEKLAEIIESPYYKGGLFDSNSGHLHPLNFILGLSEQLKQKGVKIFENTPALRLQKRQNIHFISTPQGIVKARNIILAGGAYLENIGKKITRTIMPVGTYMVASVPLTKEKATSLIKNDMAIADLNFVLDYYRMSHDYRLIFGGRVSYTKIPPLDIRQSLRKRISTVFPSLQDIELPYAWGGMVDITVNRAPHFGRLDNNIFFAQGFSGHGLSLTILAGKLMADAVAGQEEKFDVFSRIPHTPFFGQKILRRPMLVLAMLYFRMRDIL